MYRLIRCIAEHYGFGPLVVRALIVVGTVPLPKTWLGLPVLGEASQFTNLWSLLGFLFPNMRLKRRMLGTRNVLRILGRLQFFIGIGFIIYDLFSIGLCTRYGNI